MYTCIILCNMILEDKGKVICTYVEGENVNPILPPIQLGSPQALAILATLRNRKIHHNLRSDLAEYLCQVNHIDFNTIRRTMQKVFRIKNFVLCFLNY